MEEPSADHPDYEPGPYCYCYGAARRRLRAVLVFISMSMIIAVFLPQSPGTASYSSAILCGLNVVNIVMHQYLVFLLTLLHSSHLSLIS